MCEIKLTQAQVDSAMFDKARIIVMQSVGYIKILLMENKRQIIYPQERNNEFSRKRSLHKLFQSVGGK